LKVFGARGGIASEAGEHGEGKRKKRKGRRGWMEEEKYVSNTV
jgi:hypothetical protein